MNRSMAISSASIVRDSIYPHFLLDEKIMSLFEYTHNWQETQAEPFCEISGICLLFSGHFALGLPIISFMSACPIENDLARYAMRTPLLIFRSTAVLIF